MKQTQISQSAYLSGACTIAICTLTRKHRRRRPRALEPMAFLTTHEWDAKLPDSPEGKKKKIHARFTWAPSHQAIRISNEIVINGRRVLISMDSTRGIRSRRTLCSGKWTQREASPEGPSKSKPQNWCTNFRKRNWTERPRSM